MSDLNLSDSKFSWFTNVEQYPLKSSVAISNQYQQDSHPNKLNLSFLHYQHDGTPWVFPGVRTTEQVLATNFQALPEDYVQPFGYDTFNKSAILVLLGEHSVARMETRTFGVQTVSTRAAIRIGVEFLREVLNLNTIYLTDESTALHFVWLKAGFENCLELTYINSETLQIDIDGLIKDLMVAKEGSVVLLQTSHHIPTGSDLMSENWEKIGGILLRRRLFPFLYCPFPGFATGDISDDVLPARIFEKMGLEFFCAISFAWTFGLYNETACCLVGVINNVYQISPVKSQLAHIGESIMSPPSHGVRVVAYILGDRMLTNQWKECLRKISVHLSLMRTYLREELERHDTPGTWHHITDQRGLFCYLGLNELQVYHLRKCYHIYLMDNSRLNISAINLDNVKRVANAISETLTMISK